MGAEATAVSSEAKAAGHAAVATGLELVDVLFEYFVPLVALVFGIFIGPALFTGNSLGTAIWGTGLREGTPQGGAYAALIGGLVTALIMAVAGAAVWRFQSGKSKTAKWIPRAAAAFLFGWSLGILIYVGTHFASGDTAGTTLNGLLDEAVLNAVSQLQAQINSPVTQHGG